MDVFLNGRLELICGDITQLAVDVIVNAANASLCGGGGVDGAIHDAAGPGLLEECRKLGGAQTGEVKITAAYALPARFIAHAVGPVWDGGTHQEDLMLASCYWRALELTVERGCSSISFPSISTGAYRFPFDRAAKIALVTIKGFLAKDTTLRRVVLCCYSERDLSAYRKIARTML
jgi:O-acetyl-ADP-ribose deacetylase